MLSTLPNWISPSGRLRRRARPTGAIVAGLATMSLMAAACGGSSPSSASTSGNRPPKEFHAGVLNRAYAGTTINVLLPPWGQMPKSQLAKFTDATGIKVNLEDMAWDSIHDKVVTSEAAGVAPADITEVDWSWVGQFGSAGWYTPLAPYLPASVIAGSPVSPVFVSHGQQIAMPYNLDLRGMVINMADFKKAGISKPPATWAQLLSDAQQIKSRHVVTYPIGVPLSVTEGASTPWYALIKSAGGQLLTSKGTPAFDGINTPGGQALSFEETLYKDGLVPPGEVSLTDVQTNSLFAAGKVALQLSASPGDLSGDVSPSTSSVGKDDITFAPMPGNDGTKTGTFGLPEGLGIPKLSTKKPEAAMFIDWWEQLPQELESYKDPNMGNLPSQSNAMAELVRTKALVDGSQVTAVLPTVKPLFVGGTPDWYPQFSSDVATMIQDVVEGKASARSALSQLVSETKALAKQP
jgi:multiple sugar transport system substrate-binding protein